MYSFDDIDMRQSMDIGGNQEAVEAVGNNV